MDAQVELGRPFDLNEDQRAMQDMVLDFAREKVAPHAVEWDQARHLPVDVIKQTAELGMGGMYVREDVGGSALSRLDAAIAFEAFHQPRDGMRSGHLFVAEGGDHQDRRGAETADDITQSVAGLRVLMQILQQQGQRATAAEAS